MDLIGDRDVVGRGRPGAWRHRGKTACRQSGWRGHGKPGDQDGLCQPGHVRRQEHRQRMTQRMNLRRLDMDLIVMIEILAGMLHMEFARAASVVRMGMKR